MAMKIVKMEIKHVDEVTSVHMDIFKGYLNVMLGKRYNSSFFKWFIDEDKIHLLGISKTGSIIGYVVGAELGYQKALTRALLPSAVLTVIKKPWFLVNKKVLKVIGKRLKLLIYLKKRARQDSGSNKKKTISLVSIGVADPDNNTGMAALLENEFVKQARNMGFDFARLSVYLDNDRAIGFYRKKGWKIQETGDVSIVLIKKLS